MIIKWRGSEVGVFGDDKLGGKLIGDGIIDNMSRNSIGGELVRVKAFERGVGICENASADFVVGKNVAGATGLSAKSFAF